MITIDMAVIFDCDDINEMDTLINDVNKELKEHKIEFSWGRLDTDTKVILIKKII